MSSGDLRILLGEPARIRALTQCIRAKVPPNDVDDVVQSTLADALATASPPPDGLSLNRWLIGIARHKIADYYRLHRRHEWVDGDIDAQNAAADMHAETARDLLRWAHNELPSDSEAPRTLEWMMREADGDRLETIAEENNISAPAVRQRVSRLRRHLRERWALQLAAVLTAVAVIVGTYAYTQRGPSIEPDRAITVVSPVESATRLRDSALSDCANGRWRLCLEQLDRARTLDPPGDSADAIVAARSEARRALQPTPNPVPSATEEPLVPAGDEPNSLDPKKAHEPPPLHSQSKESNSPKKPRVTPPPTDHRLNQQSAPKKASSLQSKSNSKFDLDFKK